jgi:peptide-methionine (S)-S-oxide reductase
MKTIVIGGGCFWCVEAVFQRVKGVEKVVSGYAGGTQVGPTYHDHADHAEVVQLTYDEMTVELSTLLEMFFYAHNPTTLNFQGNDHGTQYRSIILVVSEAELTIAESVKTQSADLWPEPIVTEIKLLDVFYTAEEYHQDYYNQNQSAGYCQVIINPKIAKFEKEFASYLR